MPIASSGIQSARSSACAILTMCVAIFAGCATQAPPPAPAPQVQPLAEYMAEAAKAKADHLADKERETYRTAARQYPTAKEPWARLSESYFEAGDYGNAILAAQEVLQRDAADAVATGVLAVSGLRVSTQALAALRQNDVNLSGDSRSQAEGLTRSLRELLGETVLVPPPAEPPQVPPPRRRAAAAPRPAASASAAAPAATAAATAPPARSAPTPVVAKPAAKNPFDALR